MRRLPAGSVQLAVTAVLLIPAQAFGGGGGGEAIILVADSRRFTGLKLWWMNLYNDSHVYFAAFTVIIIPVVGLLLGSLTSWLMGRIGIDLKSRVLAEH